MKESVLMFCNKCGYELNDEDMFCPECGNKIKRQQSSSESLDVLEIFHTNAPLNNGDLLELLKTKSTDEFQEHQKKTISKGDIIYSATQSVNSDNSHENEKSMLDNAETTLSSLNRIESLLSEKIRKAGIPVEYHKPNKKDYKIKSTIIGRIFRIVFVFVIIFYFCIVVINMDFSGAASEMNTQIISEIVTMVCIAVLLWAVPVRNHILCRKAYKNAVKNYEYNISQDEKRCRYEKEEADRLREFLSVVTDKRNRLQKLFDVVQKEYREYFQPDANDIYGNIQSHKENNNKAVTISDCIMSELTKKAESVNFNQLITAADAAIKALSRITTENPLR